MEIETNRSSYIDNDPTVVPVAPVVQRVAPVAATTARVVPAAQGGATFAAADQPVITQPRVVQTPGVVAPAVVAQPVVAPPVVSQPVVAQSVVAQPAVAYAETRRVTRSGSVSPAAIIAGFVAVGLLILGGITVARAGIDGGIDQPIEAGGFTGTALLGFIELGFGALLLIAALARARESILFFGILGTVASVVAVFQPTIGNGSLALERGFAVLMTVVMLVVTLAAFLPTIRHSSNVVERI